MKWKKYLTEQYKENKTHHQISLAFLFHGREETQYSKVHNDYNL